VLLVVHPKRGIKQCLDLGNAQHVPSKPGALTVLKPLLFIIARHSSPSAHAASAALPNPISFVSKAASRNRFNASVGTVIAKRKCQSCTGKQCWDLGKAQYVLVV
jgi:hypothetical protein